MQNEIEVSGAVVSVKPVPVEFGEHTLFALPGSGDKDWAIVLKPTCEAMGVDYSAQLKRLKNDTKSVVAMIATTAADGKTYQSVVIDRKTFKWMLATIDAKRIWNKEARSRIERFQAEAIDAIDAAFGDDLELRDNLLTPSSEAAISSIVQVMSQVANQMASIAVDLKSLTEQSSVHLGMIDSLARRVDSLEKLKSRRPHTSNEFTRAASFGFDRGRYQGMTFREVASTDEGLLHLEKIWLERRGKYVKTDFMRALRVFLREPSIKRILDKLHNSSVGVASDISRFFLD